MSRLFRLESEFLTVFFLVVMVGGVTIGCSSTKAPIVEDSGSAATLPGAAATASGDAGSEMAQARTDPAPEHRLFDGKSLDGWEKADFGGQGDVHVEEGVLVLPVGDPLTGVRWTQSFPTMDYEIELMARRERGADFFCALTFPVGDTCASLILGGWGGETCGISSLEDMDASENETTFYRSFEMNRWYVVKLRVTKKRLEAWIDDERLVDVSITGRRIGTRPEVDLCRPLGLASYQTTAALRDIRWREVTKG